MSRVGIGIHDLSTYALELAVEKNSKLKTIHTTIYIEAFVHSAGTH